MGDLPDGGVIGWGDYVLPNEYRKKSSACGTIPIEQLLNTGRGPQTFRKSNQSPWNEVGQKIKTTGRQRWDLCPREGVLKVEKLPHTRKPAHRRGQGELRNLRGKCSQTGAPKENGEHSPQRSCEGHFSAKTWLAHSRPPTANGGWVGEAHSSGVHCHGEDQGLLPGRYSEVANMTPA